MPAYPNFIGGSHRAQGPSIIGRRVINFYVERAEDAGAKAQLALYPTPGVEEIDTAIRAPGRAHVVAAGREFVVMGSTFGEILADGSFVGLETVAVDANPATISYNGDGGGQLFVTSGGNGYIYDLDSPAWTQVRTGATTMGAHLDGFFLALDADTGTLYISDNLDGLTWDPTQFAQRSIRPDAWVSMKVHGRYIWLFGPETSEVWYNAGTSPFPFAPHASGLVPYGIAAPFSPAIVDGALVWLARTADGHGSVMRAEGFSPSVVSPFAFTVGIDGYPTIADAIGDTYQDLGHTFYLLAFPEGGMTWAYDATRTLDVPSAMRWCERGTWVSESNQYVAWRPMFHAFAYGEHRALDSTTGAIYRLSSEAYLDADERPIRRVIQPGALWDGNRWIPVGDLELFVEAGVGQATGQGADPMVALRTSKDGGRTWGAERLRSVGAIGQYKTRVVWTRNGSARFGFVPQFVFSDPVPYRVFGARFGA